MKIQTAVHLMKLLILVLQFATLTNGLKSIVLPQNVTSETGKTVTFECGYSDLNSEKIRFYIMGSKVNDSVSCPGDETKYLPAQLSVTPPPGSYSPHSERASNTVSGSMKAYCFTKSGGQVAAWEVAGTSEDDNNTVFLCRVKGADDTIGHLYVYENDSYYAKLIGYVIGGFLAALITIIAAYVLLKRSERAQQCFRGLKMKKLTELVLLTVLLALFSQAEANPFVYNYEALRIGGLVFTALLVAGGVTVLCWVKKMQAKSKDQGLSMGYLIE
ncbi:FXYD domain-containing ion transport regulator [Pimephales promelas]|nr:FXYD domain-containing ion transport regulator [Pimephales promelas]